MSTLSIVLTALLIALLALLLLARPRRLARLRSALRRRSGQELLDDALKQLSHAESRGRAVPLHTLAGRLNVPASQAARLLTQLCSMQLVEVAEDDGYRLTDEGRLRSVQIVRAHRLWERYLADRTGVEPEQWHEQAERMEHVLDEARAEELSVRLGHPPYDPHGDPIPTAAGELPEPVGRPLSGLEAGAAAVVVHIEDEPDEVYRVLLMNGIVPGVRLEVVERQSDHLRVRMTGREFDLELAVAGNVTVDPLPAGTRVRPAPLTLANAATGETVRVVGILPTIQGPQRRRLLDLGLVPGTPVTPEFESAAGDPVAYRIRGALIALRRVQAEAVEIVRVESGEPVSTASTGERPATQGDA